MKVHRLNNHIDLVADTLVRGGIVVLRTDTLYGIIVSALHANAVELLYDVRQRPKTKAMICLIGDAGQAFGGDKDTLLHMKTQYVSSSPTTYIVDNSTAPDYITRGATTCAYRIPNNNTLFKLLQKTGPLLAPSANVSDQAPAHTVQQAWEYFGDKVELYVDDGAVDPHQSPSRIVRLSRTGGVEYLR